MGEDSDRGVLWSDNESGSGRVVLQGLEGQVYPEQPGPRFTILLISAFLRHHRDQ
jgi:hypothetical protein